MFQKLYILDVKHLLLKNLNNKKMQTLMNTTNIIKEEHNSYSILSNGSIGKL